MDTNLSPVEQNDRSQVSAAVFWQHVQHRKNGAIKNWNHYASLKLFIEVGETIDPIVKWAFHDKPLAPEKVLEEIGDVLWYIASMHDQESFETSAILNERLQNEEADYTLYRQRLLIASTALMTNWVDYGNAMGVTWRAISDIIFCFGWNLQDVFAYNVAKLEKRHGQQFNPEYYTTAKAPESIV